MQIQKIYTPDFTFSGKYRTEDVLRMTTGYPYKNTQRITDTIKSLTGIDMDDETFLDLLPAKSLSGIGKLAMINICSDKARAQCKKLAKYDDTFVAKPRSKETDKITDQWFKDGIKSIGKSINLEPFSVSADELKAGYEELIKIIDKIF